MRIGLFAKAVDVEETASLLRDAEADGLDSVWITQAFGTDALVMLAALARDTSRLRLGTAVVPTYPRHPMVLAQQALTANLLLGGRLALGVGPSHAKVVEPCWGMSFDRPVRHTREYVTALTAALTQHIRFSGEVITARGDLDVVGALPPPVLLAGLGPQMLKAAGALTAGTITWMVGRRTLAELTVPGIRRAAEEASRPEPEIVVSQPLCVTSDPAGARARAEEALAWYGTLPSYQATLAREGLATPGQMAIIGTWDQVGEMVSGYADIGVTTLAVRLVGNPEERAATRALVTELARSAAPEAAGTPADRVVTGQPPDRPSRCAAHSS